MLMPHHEAHDSFSGKSRILESTDHSKRTQLLASLGVDHLETSSLTGEVFEES
jgi:hypothetical protein